MSRGQLTVLLMMWRKNISIIVESSIGSAAIEFSRVLTASFSILALAL